MALEISTDAALSRGGTMNATSMRKNVKEKSSQLNNVVDIRRIKLIELTKQLQNDCYQGKPSKEAINDFLTKVSLLRDKGSKC